MAKCPICDLDVDNVHEHVMNRHLKLFNNSRNTALFWCFCGALFGAGRWAGWKEHVEKHGGIMAHMAECSLGNGEG